LSANILKAKMPDFVVNGDSEIMGNQVGVKHTVVASS